MIVLVLQQRYIFLFCRNNEDIIVAALKGDIKDVNIHCAVEQYACSVCGKEYSECSHKKVKFMIQSCVVANL